MSKTSAPTAEKPYYYQLEFQARKSSDSYFERMALITLALQVIYGHTEPTETQVTEPPHPTKQQ